MSLLQLHDVKKIKVVRDQVIPDKATGWFTTTDIIAETDRGEFKVTFFGPLTGIPLTVEEEKK